MDLFEHLESEVRLYSRKFPTVFTKGVGSTLFDDQGRKYIDFFSGAGAVNYGHNNIRMKKRLIEYLEGDFITHSLDMATAAKGAFLERFNSVILAPRELSYKCQFCAPTGADAVEAALKLARKVTGRHTVIFFFNAYHGSTMAAGAITGNKSKRLGAGVPPHYAMPMPYDGDLGPEADTIDYLECFLRNSDDCMELPAAVIVETIQAEGGVKVASFEWLRRLAAVTKRYGIILIVDDIQVGCGRTGDFFSFEQAGVYPDIVCLSKSISGYGLPMALLLIRPEIDRWKPGDHTGTFRGNNLAFATAFEALTYWEDDEFRNSIMEKSEYACSFLKSIAGEYREVGIRGRGFIQGVDLGPSGPADQVSRAAFERGLVIETAGPQNNVLKLLPSLTISKEELEDGLVILADSMKMILGEAGLTKSAS
jgi:diaminobutyrate-2-oxoglutarate transaminase